MSDVFGAGLLSDLTKPALERSRVAALRSKQPNRVALEHEAVRAGLLQPSLPAWDQVRVECTESGEDLQVTVRIPVHGGVAALAYFPGASRWLIPEGLGGVRYQGSPWTGYGIVCTRVFGSGTTSGAIDEWRRNWCRVLKERVDEANDLIAKHNAAVRAEVRRLIDRLGGASDRVDELTS